VFEYLVNNCNLDLNYRFGGGTPYVVEAAKDNRLNDVKILVQTPRCDLNQVETSGRATALIIAASVGHISIVQILIADHRVDVNLKDINGHTALATAARKGHLDVFKVLLDSDLCEPPDEGVFSMVGRNGYRKLCKVYKEDSIPRELSPLFLSLKLRDASRDGQIEVVRTLLTSEPKIQPDIEDEYSYAPLSYAAERGHESIVSLLLSYAVVDVNRRFEMVNWAESPNKIYLCDATALIAAVCKGHTSVVQRLLKCEDIRIESVAEWPNEIEYGSSKHIDALGIALERGDEHIARLLESRQAR